MLDINATLCNEGSETGKANPSRSMSGAQFQSPASDRGWGGARANSGGARPNSGGARPGAGRKPKPIASNQISYPSDQPRWFCARTEYGAERRVVEELTKEGFESFFPQRWVPPVAARRTETGRALPATPGYLVPLLPRYLMVRFDRSSTEWRYISTMEGVERIFGTSPVWPTPIPDSDMAALRKGLTEDGILYETAPAQAEVTKRRWVDMATALAARAAEMEAV